jgi:uncharacterized protein YndB with AHSA1/START domain
MPPGGTTAERAGEGRGYGTEGEGAARRGQALTVAEVTKHIAAAPERVWAELSDGWMFTGWVVGATHIRGVDEGWPEPGTRLHHQVGAWPLVLSDTTQVLECEEPSRLVLQARAWPVGEARVVLTLEADGDGTLVRMAERPTHGLAKALHTPLQDALLRRRNTESLERLACIAENRPLPGELIPGNRVAALDDEGPAESQR